LVAINADTGERCTDFGKNGEVDLDTIYNLGKPNGDKNALISTP
jgi:quinoprotein glucose dehydrogenase